MIELTLTHWQAVGMLVIAVEGPVGPGKPALGGRGSPGPLRLFC